MLLLDLENTQEEEFVVEEDEPEREYDRKLRKGLNRIKKLDDVLADKIQREKEVKKQRRALEREFQLQVENLLQENGTDKISNSQQLLSLLSLSSDHPSDKTDTESIFATQIDPEFYNNDSNNVTSKKKRSYSSKKSPKKKLDQKFDYVKRNIELATQANAIVPLTEDEKKRLEELLADDGNLLLVENPFSNAAAISSSAYTYSQDEIEALADIDSKLKDLLPENELAILEGDNKETLVEVDNERKEKSDQTIHKDKSRKKSKSKDDLRNSKDIVNVKVSIEGLNFGDTEINCGENVLQAEKEQRVLQYRLKDIEAELKKLQVEKDALAGTINPDLLRKLLDADSRLTSSSISICESVRSNSEMLADDVTQNGSYLNQSIVSLKEISVSD